MNRENVRAVSGLTASTTQTQAGALQLDPGVAIHRVTTVGTAADAVKLPAATHGRTVTVINAAAANAMGIFPAPGDKINALAADAVYSCTANKAVIFVCAVDGTWNTVPA